MECISREALGQRRQLTAWVIPPDRILNVGLRKIPAMARIFVMASIGENGVIADALRRGNLISIEKVIYIGMP